MLYDLRVDKIVNKFKKNRMFEKLDRMRQRFEILDIWSEGIRKSSFYLLNADDHCRFVICFIHLITFFFFHISSKCLVGFFVISEPRYFCHFWFGHRLNFRCRCEHKNFRLFLMPLSTASDLVRTDNFYYQKNVFFLK